MAKAPTVVDMLHNCWCVHKYMIWHQWTSVNVMICPVGYCFMLSPMFHVNTGLYVMRGRPNLGVLAHGYKYYLTAWVFRGKLLAVPEDQCGPCCLHLCVCVCVLCTRQLVYVLTCSVDKCTQSLACALTFSSNEIQNDRLTSTKLASDMPSRHGLRRTSFDAVRPLD